MSERLAPKKPRDEFSPAVKRAAWSRCGGRCEGCDRQLEPGKYRYDHTIPTRRGGPATLANCKVLCHDGPGSCDYDKTYGEDLPGVAAAKRYGKNRLPLDITRPTKQEPKMRGRSSWAPRGSQKIPSRPFQRKP